MMKKHVAKMMCLVVSAVVVVVVSGCSCPQYAGSEKTVSSLETASSKNVEILWADSHQLEDKTVIHGTLKRKTRGSAAMKAHVDVQVLTAEGEVVQEIHSPNISIPRNLPGKGIKFERFEIELDDAAVENSTILVSAHQGNHDM